jgi:hypothetical protein
MILGDHLTIFDRDHSILVLYKIDTPVLEVLLVYVVLVLIVYSPSRCSCSMSMMYKEEGRGKKLSSK